jgi:hypothetical protein
MIAFCLLLDEVQKSRLQIKNQEIIDDFLTLIDCLIDDNWVVSA